MKIEIVVRRRRSRRASSRRSSTTANTGAIGDGKIFVLDVDQAMRIRTGETNDRRALRGGVT